MNILDVISGRADGPAPAFVRWGLWCLTPIYRFAINRRNRQFDREANSKQPSRVTRVQVPVISVGNLTTGGTGKTPHVIEIARRLRRRGARVALISRGYGSRTDHPKLQGANDEALELESRLPDVPHLQDPDRVRMAEVAVEELESEVVLLDDGFQHRRLYRNLDIVIIDALIPFGYGYLLPRGLLREPIASLQRADLVIISRSDLVENQQREAIRNQIAAWVSEHQILESRVVVTEVITSSGSTANIESIESLPVFAFCGIGNPEGFLATLEQKGIAVVGSQAFPDHHAFDRSDLDSIGEAAQACDARQILCTHKDLVKIGVDRIAGIPLAAVLIEIEITRGSDVLDEAINSCLDDAASIAGHDLDRGDEPDNQLS